MNYLGINWEMDEMKEDSDQKLWDRKERKQNMRWKKLVILHIVFMAFWILIIGTDFAYYKKINYLTIKLLIYKIFSTLFLLKLIFILINKKSYTNSYINS